MIKFLFGGVFLMGAIAILWIGSLLIGVNTLGLGVTCLIGAVYLIGTYELLSFRKATATLMHGLSSLTAPVDNLNEWINQLAPSLQTSVRLRVAGERVALPAPVVTPYLIGLLVMLGLLGTFIGMVDTLKGAVGALEGSTELEAIRAGLAAPIEGLGLAFGTSVAGVAASAMLGLLSTISRRERLQTSQALDHKTITQLSHFSVSHRQDQAFQAMQDHAQALPSIANQLAALVGNLDNMSDRVSTQLLDNQRQFHDRITVLYSELNESVDRSLKTTLVESAQHVGNQIQPMAESTLKQLNDTALETQQQLVRIGEEQGVVLQSLSEGYQAQSKEALTKVLKQQVESADALLTKVSTTVDSTLAQSQSSHQTLLDGFDQITATWAERQTHYAQQVSAVMQDELSQLREQESERGAAAVDKLRDMEAMVAVHLTDLGQALEAPMTRLIETASETPKAAAEVIQQLRDEITKNVERDNELLVERTRIIKQLDGLTLALEQNSVSQREAIDQLVEHSTTTLEKVGNQFGNQVVAGSDTLSKVADHFATSSAEMASLSDAFKAAVALFSDSNNQLIDNLSRIEAALEKSSSRSDEQLAYYVAQAREIIDHNVLSHQQIIDALKVKDQSPVQLAVDGVSSGSGS